MTGYTDQRERAIALKHLIHDVVQKRLRSLRFARRGTKLWRRKSLKISQQPF